MTLGWFDLAYLHWRYDPAEVAALLPPQLQVDVHDGVPGVWFFSLDVSRFLPAVVARLSYRLTYCRGRAGNKLVYGILSTSVSRRWPQSGPSTSIAIRTGERITEPSPLEIFLSAR